MRSLSRISILLSFLLFSNQVVEAQKDTILVDLGNLSSISAFPWNNLTDPVSGFIHNLINDKGFSTSISLAVHDAFSDINTNGTQNPDPLLGIPASATRDNFFGNILAFSGITEPTGGLRFSGLNSTKNYTLVLFASRIASDNRETRYVVSGSIHDTLFLEVTSNTALFVTTTLSPDSTGAISVVASPGPNNTNVYGFYHLSALKLIYDEEPPGPAVLQLKTPSGGEVWQTGKSPKITWHSENVPEVIIEYSFTNGASWLVVDTVAAYLQSFTWDVPGTPSLQCLVRISYDSLSDTCDFVFEIAADTIQCPIVILGSSTAAGAGPSVSDSAWVKRFSSYLGQRNTRFKIINLAYGGYTTYHILPTGTYIPPHISFPIDTSRNITKALSYNPFAIIVNMPSNDAAYYVPVSQQLINFASIFDAANYAGVSTWICSPQPRNFSNPTKLQIQFDLKDSLIAIYGGKAMDFWTGLADSQGHIQSIFDSGDGIHLNNAGHGHLFNQVLMKHIDSVDCSITVGVGNHQDESIADIMIYPNPFRDDLFITLNTNTSALIAIELYDAMGRCVWNYKESLAFSGRHTIAFRPELSNPNPRLLFARIKIFERNAVRQAIFKVLSLNR